MQTRKILKAYEQVAAQLRDMILAGEVVPGQRLPSEAELTKDFAVSRTTVREALRILASEQLVATSQGSAGGTYVATPSLDKIALFLHSSVAHLTQARDVSLTDFMRTRQLLEVDAARLAATRFSKEGMGDVLDHVRGNGEPSAPGGHFTQNRDFHRAILEISGNVLLSIAAEPVFTVLQINLARAAIPLEFYEMVDEHHRRIADAIVDNDPDRAAREMESHLIALRPTYERIWKQPTGSPRHED